MLVGSLVNAAQKGLVHGVATVEAANRVVDASILILDIDLV
jgi:hypothetical protein